MLTLGKFKIYTFVFFVQGNDLFPQSERALNVQVFA